MVLLAQGKSPKSKPRTALSSERVRLIQELLLEIYNGHANAAQRKRCSNTAKEILHWQASQLSENPDVRRNVTVRISKLIERRPRHAQAIMSRIHL